MKDSFILRKSDQRKLKRLTDEQLGKLMRVLFAYEFEQEEPDENIDPVIGVAFDSLAERLDADREKYDSVCKANKEKAEKRWKDNAEPMPEHTEPMPNDAEACRSMPQDAEACRAMPSDAELCVSDTDTDSDIKEKDTLSSIQKEKRQRFSPPTLEEVREYCALYAKEKGLPGINPEDFYDFYESKNWMIGREKMKDWKAAARRWIREDSKRSRAAPAKSTVNFKQRDDSYSKMLEDGNW